MKASQSTELSRRKAALVASYVDGEAGPLRAALARRLIRRDQAAAAYAVALRDVRRAAAAAIGTAPQLDSLWDRIERRIDQEERRAILASVPVRTSLFARLLRGHASDSWGQRFTWGASGAAFATVLSLLVIQFGTNTQHRPGLVAGAQPSSARPVPVMLPGERVRSGASFASFSEDAPRARTPLAASSMAFDWVKSEGRVRLLRDPSGTSEIIWIRKHSSGPIARFNGREAFVPDDVVRRAKLTPEALPVGGIR